MQRYMRKIEKMITFCCDLSGLSTCQRYPTAAIVFPFDCTSIYAIGYNGPPVGTPNDSCVNATGDCGCVHAEANALLKLTGRSPAILFCTVSPCVLCAGLIINSQRIDYVIYDKEYRNSRGVRRLLAAKIHIDLIKDINYDRLLEWRKARRVKS